MKVRKLDANGDMTFGAGRESYLVDSVDAVAQCVLTRLRLWRGEWYLDKTEGTDYGKVLGRGTESSSAIALQERVLSTPGVRRIVSMSANHDPDTRHASFAITIETDYGVTTVYG